MPWPKYSFQRRLTKTRAVSGLSRETIQLGQVQPGRRGRPGVIELARGTAGRPARSTVAGVVHASCRDAGCGPCAGVPAVVTRHLGTASSSSSFCFSSVGDLVARRLEAAARWCGSRRRSPSSAASLRSSGATARAARTFAGSDCRSPGSALVVAERRNLPIWCCGKCELEFERERQRRRRRRRSIGSASLEDRRRAACRPAGRIAQPVSSLPSIAVGDGKLSCE